MTVEDSAFRLVQLTMIAEQMGGETVTVATEDLRAVLSTFVPVSAPPHGPYRRPIEKPTQDEINEAVLARYHRSTYHKELYDAADVLYRAYYHADRRAARWRSRALEYRTKALLAIEHLEGAIRGHDHDIREDGE